MSNPVYSIGLGPGDPELLTIKAQKLLKEADIIVVPKSKKKQESLAMQIVLNYIDKEKTFTYHFPMHNSREDLDRRYRELASKIKTFIEEGKKVCYVTLGDPTIYSTSNYLTSALYNIGIEVIHIPGISAINAASAFLGLPLCIKGDNFAVYEMPKKEELVKEYILRHSTTVFMKVNKKLKILIDAITNMVSDVESAYLISRLGLESEKVFDLTKEHIPDEAAYLSLAIIRKRKASH